MAKLGHCLSLGVNALHEKVNSYGAGISSGGLTRRMAQAGIVAQADDLDMVEAGWEPTVDTYLIGVPKAHILEAVHEAKGGWDCTAPRSPEEGRDSDRGRALAEGQRLVARGPAPRRCCGAGQ